MLAENNTSDWKRNAGATRLASRKKISPRLACPRSVRGSVKFPAFRTGSQELYFLPDAVLLAKGRDTAVVSYQELRFSNRTVSFIEGGPIPGDAVITGHTWRYVNKSGGPDRRFNDNRELAVCAYGELEFFSESGVNCVIQYSKNDAADRFARAIEILSRPESRIVSNPITQLRSVGPFPLLLFAIPYFMTAASVGALSYKAGSVRQSSASSSIIERQAGVDYAPKIVDAPKSLVPRYDAAPVPRHDAPPRAQAVPLREIAEPGPSSQRECLLMANIDDRVDCLEAVHANGQRK